ncbi:hypothetical protein [Mucilaginibacter terrae]|uniref:DUF4252 domain-containing protein n=1 Tax=Mucilaginibacter terrae TaxID=1955052 RepID=A0ABU3GUI9_9SPHI|nr:hypothetical protein [Mucilaginibacter terrae]MDT3403433.1 hypothetical protein [Mucilaginibacter terrae]
MKKLLLIYIVILMGISIKSKAQVTKLNNYKYIYLAPLTYNNGRADHWGIREQVKKILRESGVAVLDSLNTGQMPSLTLTCVIEHSNNLYQFKREYIDVKFLDFDNHIVYAAHGQTGAMALTIKSGYKSGVKNALKDFENYQYKYTGSTIE